ncbi:Ams1p [Lipomyces orientalis]|uniref:Ams1p n=1 Tax=Lipomyces orientalis TaxID=1233043 RepID=A0ACC3TJE3_9ASCO
MEVYSVPGMSRPRFAVASKEKYRPVAKGESFGPSWTTHWFKIEIKVPDSWLKVEPVVFNWNCGNEGLIFSEEGKVIQGLSGEERREWILPASWNDGQWHTFYIETSCNGMFGNADPNDNIQPPYDDRFFKLESADLAWINPEARALRLDFTVISECAKEMPPNSWQKHRALEVANAIIDSFDESDVTSIARCRDIAAQFIGTKANSPEVFKPDQEALIMGVGHCHIDTAWLWPYAETRRKIGRSWSTQLDLIERYPEYNFVCSQAVQYQWLKEDYPDLFERLKVQIKAGRFIPTGGSWVESDTNLPSGESIARQFIYGQRFFEANFGIRCKTFWLPDTFGYSAQIPQLCRGAGMERFVTQKLSWNNINNFPNTTFNWVALDGSQVMCHMPPGDTYLSSCTVEDIYRSLNNHKNSGIDQTSLLLFGYGDGGGGANSDMLERMRRARGVADTVGEIPRVEMEGNVEKYFDRVEKRTDSGSKLVSWTGELYFEYHRGTYTTQGFVKKANRESEALLHDVELLATIASLTVPGFKYPKQQIDEVWKLVLLNQFHDVLPGSCIEMVYDDVKEIVKVVRGKLESLLTSCYNSLGLSGGGELVAVNTLPWARSEVLKFESISATTSTLSQDTKDGKYVLLESSGSSLVGVGVAAGLPLVTATAEEITPGVFQLSNGQLKVIVEGGWITSMVDITNGGREIIAKGREGNQHVLYDDQPLNWQGWDTEVYSLNKKKIVPPGEVSILENGPLRAALLVKQRISEKSWMESTISLDMHNTNSAFSSYLEFNSEIEWHESCKFLKVEFPVNVHCDYATYETMYGAVRRPTHYNTFWDVAKFEVCTHKYTDFSDFTYGVTVLNDSKYGFAVHGNTMRLSLLRSPKAPDAHADMGRHSIRYAVYGHAGPINADVVKCAFNFNHPLKAISGGIAGSIEQPFYFEGPQNVVISVIKRADDDEDVSTDELPTKKGKSIILRLYDSLGGHSYGYIVSKFPIKAAYRTNLLEDDGEEIKPISRAEGTYALPISLRAFEIGTFRLRIK